MYRAHVGRFAFIQGNYFHFAISTSQSFYSPEGKSLDLLIDFDENGVSDTITIFISKWKYFEFSIHVLIQTISKINYSNAFKIQLGYVCEIKQYQYSVTI